MAPKHLTLIRMRCICLFYENIFLQEHQIFSIPDRVNFMSLSGGSFIVVRMGYLNDDRKRKMKLKGLRRPSCKKTVKKADNVLFRPPSPFTGKKQTFVVWNAFSRQNSVCLASWLLLRSLTIVECQSQIPNRSEVANTQPEFLDKTRLMIGLWTHHKQLLFVQMLK